MKHATLGLGDMNSGPTVGAELTKQMNKTKQNEMKWNWVCIQNKFLSGSFVNMQGKPLTDSELIKSCLIAVAKDMYPGKKIINLLRSLDFQQKQLLKELRKSGTK